MFRFFIRQMSSLSVGIILPHAQMSAIFAFYTHSWAFRLLKLTTNALRPPPKWQSLQQKTDRWEMIAAFAVSCVAPPVARVKTRLTFEFTGSQMLHWGGKITPLWTKNFPKQMGSTVTSSCENAPCCERGPMSVLISGKWPWHGGRRKYRKTHSLHQRHKGERK